MVTLKLERENSTTPMSDEEIMTTILGKITSYVKGMRYGPKPPRS